MVGIKRDGPAETRKPPEPVSPTRDLVLKYMEEKDKIEREIQDLRDLLVEQGDVGMDQPLLDEFGHVRNDVDAHRIRMARNQINSLQRSHRAIMKFIEDGIHLVHAEARGEGPSRVNAQPMEVANGNAAAVNGNGLSNGSAGRQRAEDARVAGVVAATNNLNMQGAFVRVNRVDNGSPADIAGMRVNDEILQFGSINTVNFASLYQIGSLVQNSVGAPIEVRLRRGNDIMNVTLVPQRWAGTGLLGCNVVNI